NVEKTRVRIVLVEGKVGKEALLQSVEQQNNSPGTCTFSGPAKSNQMLREVMGLQLPDCSFVNPDTPLRKALSDHAVAILAERCRNQSKGLGELLEAEHMVNAMIGLLATGGSTNHTLHIPAIAKAAGWQLDWQDFADLSEII